MALRVHVDGLLLEVPEQDQAAWRRYYTGERTTPPLRAPAARPTIRTCANCGTTWQDNSPSTRPQPYCTLACRGQAKAVRYGRRVLVDHDGLDRAPVDVQQAIAMKVAHALGGGYDGSKRRLPPRVRQAVKIRDGGRCVLCHDLGQEIDHINGPSPDLTNLRLLCRDCHQQVTNAHLRPIVQPEMLALRDELRRRIEAPSPTRPCDHPDWMRCGGPGAHGTAPPDPSPTKARPACRAPSPGRRGRCSARS